MSVEAKARMQRPAGLRPWSEGHAEPDDGARYPVRHGEVLAEQLRKSLGIELTLDAVDRATTVDRIIRHASRLFRRLRRHHT